jgi:thioredoxin
MPAVANLIVVCPNCGAKNRVEEKGSNVQPVCGRCGAKLAMTADAGDGHPMAVTDQTFAQVIQDSRPVLVDFWAEWCPPCRAIAPVLDQIAREANGRYVVAKLNVDENQQTAGQFRIEGIPTMLIFKNGKLVDRLVGAHPKQTIVQHLQSQV